jgi:hypothetical protein
MIWKRYGAEVVGTFGIVIATDALAATGKLKQSNRVT